MYRALTYTAIKKGLSCKDEKSLTSLAGEISLEFVRDPQGFQRVYCYGTDITEEIRDPRVSQRVSQVACHEGVRFELVKKQQELAQSRNVVMDGRDIGTIVLPLAECKVYLTASVEERARRRHLELTNKGFKEDYETIRKELEERDQLDQNRAIGPLRKAADAVIIDTTYLTQEQVIQKLMDICVN